MIHSSPISVSSPISITSPETQAVVIPDEDTAESDPDEWWVPENQLGLEPLLEDRWNDQVVTLDEKCKIEHHEAVAIY
jgi:hypothetical protein